MTGDKTARRKPSDGPPADESDTEGAERYLWAYRDGTRVVLSIPGIRDLTFTESEARSIGQMLIDAAEDERTTKRKTDLAEETLNEKGNKNGD